MNKQNQKFILYFILISILFACKEDSTSIKVKYFNINGQSVSYLDYLPLKNAFIYTEPPTETAISDENGNFVLNNIPEGNYTIIAEKKGFYQGRIDIGVYNGNFQTIIIALPIEKSGNHAPEVPILIYPKDDIKLTFNNLTLSWSCFDKDSDNITYDIYLDDKYPPTTQIISSFTKNSFTIKNLKDSTDYYWKIIAKDKYGATSISSIASFGVYTNPTNSFFHNLTDLVLYYSFNNNANDISGNNLNGTIHSANLTTDRFGNINSAYSFDGSSAYIESSSNTLLNLGNYFTICAWIKPNTGYGKNNADYIDIVSRWGSISPNAASYFLAISSSGKIKAAITNNGYDITAGSGNTTIAVGKWSHIAMTFDGESVNLYVNGVKDGSFSSNAPQASSYTLYIGSQRGGFAYFNGSIDDVYLFKRTLTSNEILELYENN